MTYVVIARDGKTFTVEADYFDTAQDFASMTRGAAAIFFLRHGGEGRRGMIVAAFNDWQRVIAVDDDAEKRAERHRVKAAVDRITQGDSFA